MWLNSLNFILFSWCHQVLQRTFEFDPVWPPFLPTKVGTGKKEWPLTFWKATDGHPDDPPIHKQPLEFSWPDVKILNLLEPSNVLSNTTLRATADDAFAAPVFAFALSANNNNVQQEAARSLGCPGRQLGRGDRARSEFESPASVLL